MELEASVLVHRPAEQVWAYLSDISNVSRWDRGVTKVCQTSQASSGVGLEFDTLAHPRGEDHNGDWGKMSYRITQADPAIGCTVQLTSSSGNARFFKNAEWRWRVKSIPEGSVVTCVAAFTLRLRYVLLTPLLFFMSKGIRSDLVYLKEKLESATT